MARRSTFWTATARPVKTAPGVVDALTAADVPGENDISPTGRHDEPILAEGKVQFFGQPVFCVIAETRELARRACRFAKIEYEELPAILDVADAMLVPVLPSVLDMEATVRFLNPLAEHPRVARGELPVGLVANRLRPWTQASQQSVTPPCSGPRLRGSLRGGMRRRMPSLPPLI